MIQQKNTIITERQRQTYNNSQNFLNISNPIIVDKDLYTYPSLASAIFRVRKYFAMHGICKVTFGQSLLGSYAQRHLVTFVMVPLQFSPKFVFKKGNLSSC